MSARRYQQLRLVVLAALCCATFADLAPAQASAFPDNPAWTVSVMARPANFVKGDHSGNDFFEAIITNTGDGSTDGSTITITDTLPHGLALAPAGVSGTELLSGAALSCAGLTCSYSGVVAAGDTFTLDVPVEVEEDASSGEMNAMTVAGGGAFEAATSTPLTISPTFPGFAVAPGSFSNALANTQAGAHADLTTSFYFNRDAEGGNEGDLKDTVVDLPPGFAGDPAAAPTCTEAQLYGKSFIFSGCPVDSQVGTVTVELDVPNEKGPYTEIPFTAPVFNMAPLGGEITRLGFKVLSITSNIVITVRPGEYGLRATAPNLVSGTIQIGSVKLTAWGVPSDPSHDLMRGTTCIGNSCFGPEFSEIGVASTLPPEPFLSNPTQCTGESQTSTIRVDTWQNRPLPSEPSASVNIGPITGCERLEFNPAITIQSSTDLAASPTGLTVNLLIPQSYSNPAGLATSALKNAVVALPEGVTINPSAGEGLGVCTTAEYEAEAVDSIQGSNCPNESNLGTVTTETPVLKELATGSVFLAQPYNNPFSEPGHPHGSLLAIYIVARIPARGIIVKAAGKITPNPITGQLVTSFEDNPQLPFNRFTLSFRPGEAAPLVSPPTCGEYKARAEFTSWSEPLQVLTDFSPAFEVTQGVGGGACPSGGVPPFVPQVISGTLSNAAATYSPFYLRIVRKDGEQEITKFTTVLPPGLTGNLSGIPNCPEADIEAARQASGREEIEKPSCPAASEIGHTLVGAGVGGVLAQTPGKIYLAGPYHGSALSIVSITSATVGPFDLGTVVIRFALLINPITAQVEVDGASSDPIPHIIKGVVVHARDIRVYMNREKFILNPTSCNAMSISDTVVGAGANFANPADQMPVGVSTPFQASDCSSLGFKPNFQITASAETSRTDGVSLNARLVYPNVPLGTQSNIARVKVELPKELPSRLTTLQKACPDSVFTANPSNCPAASRIGEVAATTPIIPAPINGPAYFVSHGGVKFPELVVLLTAPGYGFQVQLHGETFISKAGITSSTFSTVPDVPIGTFDLKLPAGPYSALAANGNLCKAKHLAMPTEFIAQNGDEIHQSTPIAVTGCPKVAKTNRKRHHKGHKAKRRKKK